MYFFGWQGVAVLIGIVIVVAVSLYGLARVVK